MRRLKAASAGGDRPARGRHELVARLTASAMLGLTLQGCLRPCSPGQLDCPLQPCSPSQVRERARIDLDERVEDWRVNGGTTRPRFIHAAGGCYLLEVKYSEHYTRVHGVSSLWGISPLAAAVDTATKVKSSHYETGYVPFALHVRPQHSYHVTATFDGDEFMPRIIELNAAAERTREIFPLRSKQQLDSCKAHSRSSKSIEAVCGEPSVKARGVR
jgi:hypothetical protein